MTLSLIVAVSRNGVIGRDGGLPWHLSDDLKRFKRLTMGHHILMGRKTFESLGRCLPGRTTIVVTSRPKLADPGALIAADLPAALRLAGDDPEPFVIGGARLFDAAFPLSDRVYLTRVLADVEGDVRLELDDWRLDDRSRWTLEESSEPGRSNDGLEYRFETYRRATGDG